MAKGITAPPKKKRKGRRLSEHAQLVEERARSIPPGVVHELFDTSGLPVPPPAPVRPARGRLASKPPPHPPRPSRSPPPPPARPGHAHAGADAELADLEELEEVEELEELDALEESQPEGFGSHTVPPAPGVVTGPRHSWQRSRLLPAVLGVALVGGLALATGRKFDRPSTAASGIEAKAASLKPSVAPTLPPAAVAREPRPADPVTKASSAPPASDDAEPPASPGPGAALNAAVVAVSPDAVSVAASNRVHGSPATGAARRAPVTPTGVAAFDVAAAEAAIEAAFQRARACRTASDPKGVATVALTYAPSGRITTALVSGVFAGTSTGSCIAAALRSARIPAYSGSRVTVKRSANL
jgi:hypothetical protein